MIRRKFGYLNVLIKSAMRKMHDAVDVRGMAGRCELHHLAFLQPSYREGLPMFVRAVWRVKRLVDLRQTLREMDVPSTRDADLPGISGPDFSKMTRSLFDR
jgi:hypothetical protein